MYNAMIYMIMIMIRYLYGYISLSLYIYIYIYIHMYIYIYIYVCVCIDINVCMYIMPEAERSELPSAGMKRRPRSHEIRGFNVSDIGGSTMV